MSAMDAEFDTVAEWTADAAEALGAGHFLAAGCRGSGGPATLDLLLDGLAVEAGDRLLDVGAGVGGPAAYAQRTRALESVLIEPEAGACRAARRLFGLPTVRSDGLALPFPAGAFARAWSLGVLCTTADHRAALRELRRVLSAGGRLALLVYVASGKLPEQPEGNHFPSPDSLRSDAAAAGFEIVHAGQMVSPDGEAPAWRAAAAAVNQELEARHADDQAWQEAQAQSATMGRLLGDGHVDGQVILLQAR